MIDEPEEPPELRPWQRHPTEREKARAEKELRMYTSNPRLYRDPYPRARGRSPSATFCSGGLPGLGKRR